MHFTYMADVYFLLSKSFLINLSDKVLYNKAECAESYFISENIPNKFRYLNILLKNEF